jgi:hypothetical protein
MIIELKNDDDKPGGDERAFPRSWGIRRKMTQYEKLIFNAAMMTFILKMHFWHIEDKIFKIAGSAEADAIP